MSKPKRTLACLFAVAALLLVALGAGTASAAFEIEGFDGSLTATDGSTLTQAGSHADFTTKISIPRTTNAFGEAIPVGSLRDVAVKLPAGLIGDPSAATTCTDAQLVAGPDGIFPACPIDAQVGVAWTDMAFEPAPFPAAIYRMQPAPGVPAQFAMNIIGTLVYISADLVYADGYRVEAKVSDISQGIPILGSEITFWGVPNDSAHDSDRFSPPASFGKATDSPRRALMSLPTECSGTPLPFELRARSWQEPENRRTASFFSHDGATPPNPVAISGCDGVPFAPAVAAAATTAAADSPTGLDVHLDLPQSRNPDGVSTAAIKRIEMALPEGVSVNPSSVDGLGACASAQIGIGNEAPVACPPSSKIGTVAIQTPLLDEALGGSVYLAAQGDNPFNSLLALYVVAESRARGVLIKLAGQVIPDPNTGRLVAIFDDNPQLPFSSLDVNLKSGPKAPLITPSACGTYTTEAQLTPWSAANPDNPTAAEIVTSISSFRIGQGPNGGPCPAGRFAPILKAGTTNPLAGAYSPFVLGLAREDGTQLLKGLSLTLPKGLIGKLAGIPYCPGSVLAAIPTGQGTGAAQVAAPSCPAASRVGTVSVGAGAGPSPYFVNTGKAYLAGPYKGAPLSLAVVTPAVAGPFDLGNVVVRNALQVNPATAQITTVSDPLPTILHGIPLDLRDLRVSLDKPDFTLNPTSCDPMSFSGTASAPSGATASVSDRFQVGSCERLDFKPKLALRLSGPTRRGTYPKLRATLTMPKGGANIARAAVTLPKTEILAQEHIKTICTRVQYAAKACPARSVYGYAKAWSPLLDKPLEGPVYLRSSSHELPDLVASLDGQIHIDLQGRIDSKNARIRNTFDLVPDAPVSKFVLTMQGGKKSLLVNNTQLCKAKPVADALFNGQNGKSAELHPRVKVDCGKARKK